MKTDLTFDPIKTVEWKSYDNLPQNLYKYLKEMIIEGALSAGYMFPNENQLCSILNVARGTLRDSYRELEANGFITRTKSGTFVNDIATIAETGSFRASLEISKYENLIEFLLITDPEASYLAAQRATKDELAEIHKLMLKAEFHSSDMKSIEHYNNLFHAKILAAAHNSLLINSIAASRSVFEQSIAIRTYNLTEYTEQFMDTCFQQHHQLYYAIKEKDGEKAKNITREHILHDIERIKQLQEKSCATTPPDEIKDENPQTENLEDEIFENINPEDKTPENELS